MLQLATASGNYSDMPYSFSAGDRKLANELGTLRKLGNARRVASADRVNRAAQRVEVTSDEAGEPPPPMPSPTAKPSRRS